MGQSGFGEQGPDPCSSTKYKRRQLEMQTATFGNMNGDHWEGELRKLEIKRRVLKCERRKSHLLKRIIAALPELFLFNGSRLMNEVRIIFVSWPEAP